ncbi:MAG: pyruvate:ferredoxin (flavodoxin) oxidoreductase [Actinomycetota bacterium]
MTADRPDTTAPGAAPPVKVVVDGNEAAARVAHACSEVVAIYPITPASPMGELADAWSGQDRPNIWGAVPDVIEMQSEGGAAGALHGALQAGTLATTFTASQGLLLMIPNLYKVVGELTPTVIHVAARSIATHALSIFGDHSDVMAARQTGAGMLFSSSVQESQDLALVAHAATLRSRIPFVHAFDGFRTSHEVNTIVGVDDDTIRAMIDDRLVEAHRARALDSEHPVVRGTAQNPDVFFQGREAANPFFDDLPGIVAAEMDRFAELTGRSYGLVDYHGAPDAEHVTVVMASASPTIRAAVDERVARGERVGVLTVRLYRPFPTEAFLAALPATATRVAVLDRTKEPGAAGEPLFLDVVAAVAEARQASMPMIVGGRYGLSSKELTPAMAGSIYDELASEAPRRRFTVGIVDDVGGLSLPLPSTTTPEPARAALFYGLGSDGTVGANKQSAKIIGEREGYFSQGYFVYDSKKSGSITVSHLRFGQEPIDAPYLIEEADFVACHDFGLLDKIDVLERAARGATFLLNSPHPAEETWDRLPLEIQERVIELGLRVMVIDAGAVALRHGLGRRVNTVLQTCCFALIDVLPFDEAVTAIKHSIEYAYSKRGEVVVARNLAAVDDAIEGMTQLDVPSSTSATRKRRLPLVNAPEGFVTEVTATIVAGNGDALPVSAMPLDGTFPTGTAALERRSIATEIPIWDPTICIECARCALVCPHAAIRVKAHEGSANTASGDPLPTREISKTKELSGFHLTVQVAPDDCTGCGICVEICPARDKTDLKHQAIDMLPKDEHLELERERWDAFVAIEDPDRRQLRVDTVKGSQQLRPLFEFSGACTGCGETPYLKLMSQLFGDRALIANATGCSSIYGGNLPTTPWTTNDDGRGPAWSNSLFEDNAEFGLGMRLAADQLEVQARAAVEQLRPELGELADRVLDRDQTDEQLLSEQRADVAELTERLGELSGPVVDRLRPIVDHLVRRSVWIVGGDGWAYDIGFGGVDHVLASGRDVNVLVLDTEVYSNTGGQASKATPRAAVAKFASNGKSTGKKDLGLIAQDYGHVYVAQIAMGANLTQTVKAFIEAEQYPGPSLIIAYSPCIAHGIDMRHQMDHQKQAAACGYWPLYRYDPSREAAGEPGLRLDSRSPTGRFADFARSEGRFAMLSAADPEHAAGLIERAQRDIDDRWQLYEQMVHVHRTAVYVDHDEEEHS